MRNILVGGFSGILSSLVGSTIYFVGIKFLSLFQETLNLIEYFDYINNWQEPILIYGTVVTGIPVTIFGSFLGKLLENKMLTLKIYSIGGVLGLLIGAMSAWNGTYYLPRYVGNYRFSFLLGATLCVAGIFASIFWLWFYGKFRRFNSIL